MKTYTDKAGNTLYKKIQSNGRPQFYAKNKYGRLVNEEGVITLMKNANINVQKNNNIQNKINKMLGK